MRSSCRNYRIGKAKNQKPVGLNADIHIFKNIKANQHSLQNWGYFSVMSGAANPPGSSLVYYFSFRLYFSFSKLYYSHKENYFLKHSKMSVIYIRHTGAVGST